MVMSIPPVVLNIQIDKIITTVFITNTKDCIQYYARFFA